MLDSIIEQMTQAQGITEVLKATDQMTWVARMNNIQASAMEIVNKKIIYAQAKWRQGVFPAAIVARYFRPL